MSDDVVWQLIKNGFCSFRKLTDVKAFCSNVYNVTGLCNHASCPLANSNYSTVIEDQGDIFLCVKRSERAHLPRDMWEKVQLPKSERQAVTLMQQHLKFGISSHLFRKCCLKFRRIRESLSSLRRASLSSKFRIVPRKTKTERRERSREFKALLAAKLSNSIENELLNRLNNNIYNLSNYSKINTIENEVSDLKDDKIKLKDELKLKQKKSKRRDTVNIEYELEDNTQDFNLLNT